MIEVIGIAAICIGTVALGASGITTLAIAYSPTVSSPQKKYDIDETKYQERLMSNYDSVYMYSGFGSYPRAVLWRSSIGT
ncbi:unnamed protein product [Rotaria socialis]|uniref:Uncharacterized protein n=1 Tax=Rotaria socialis TaxID=392032 RepID=A0A820B0S7_9BILA|nr:unnamed protein product [Rotaria socialis]CAF3641617.1 unnamed protein product [Rotaria socialis]CAF4193698.1 unnamed protein product [Rotaria socialis]CAF4352324.1 unnamed protein product [Rotaria socialis]CAF4474705.1 unnamed protein product [Rotaria socialis]